VDFLVFMLAAFPGGFLPSVALLPSGLQCFMANNQ
jgi:hypothetical protein